MNPIPRDHPSVEAIRRIIAPDFQTHAWIAGSAACRFPSNADVDVWLMGGDGAHIRRWKAWEEQIRGIVQHPTNVRSAETSDRPNDIIYPDGSSLIFSGVIPGASHNIHILVSLQASIQDVLARFDISCHCAAVNLATWEQVTGPGYTVAAVRPLTPTSIRSTLARLLKFSVRYQDESIWADPSCQKLALEAFEFPVLTREEAWRMCRMRVLEGL